MATPILDIDELANGQVDQYLTANASTRAIEAAANDFLSVDLSAGNATLTAAQYRGYVLFRSSGNTVARDLTLQAIKRLVVVENGGTATLSVKLGTTTITISAGEAGLLYSDGTANGLTSVASGGGGGGATTSILSPDTATTHTATSTDNGGLLIFNSSSDCTLTVPQTSTEALDAGFHILALNEGGGNLSVAIEGSDTIDGVKLWADATQAVTIIKDTAGSPNDWRMIGNSWMPEAVENDALTAPPATPAVGAVYIPAATATGTWATHENEFVIHLGSDVYDFVTPPVGLEVYEKTSAVWIGWNDTSWVDIQANEADTAKLNVAQSFTAAQTFNEIIASSKGISFPATQVPSANANTLDDYEEGTFTPTLYGVTTAGSPTYTEQSGSYVKIGDMYIVTAYIDLLTKGGMVGQIRIAGLPATAGLRTALATTVLSGANITAGHTIISSINAASSEALIKVTDVSVGSTNIIDTEITDTLTILVSGYILP